MKKTLFILLAVVLALSALAPAVFAQDATTDVDVKLVNGTDWDYTYIVFVQSGKGQTKYVGRLAKDATVELTGPAGEWFVELVRTDGKRYTTGFIAPDAYDATVTVNDGVPVTLTYVLTAPAAPAAPAGNTIVDVAVADGRFTTLVAAVTAADLVDTLSGPGPYTVFAPTDDAFAKLPAGTVEALLADIPTLSNILLYHVVPGNVTSAQVVTLTSAMTANGQAVTIKVVDGKVFVNDAQVIITDVAASNGVIHVIDTVLIPPTRTTYTVVDGDTLYGIAARLGLNFADLLAANNLSDPNLIIVGQELNLP